MQWFVHFHWVNDDSLIDSDNTMQRKHNWTVKKNCKNQKICAEIEIEINKCDIGELLKSYTKTFIKRI